MVDEVQYASVDLGSCKRCGGTLPASTMSLCCLTCSNFAEACDRSAVAAVDEGLGLRRIARVTQATACGAEE